MLGAELAVGMTAYVLVAIRLEERDLMRMHPEYAEYRKQVPMLIPALPRPQVSVRAESGAQS